MFIEGALVTALVCMGHPRFCAVDEIVLQGFYGADGHRDDTRCVCRVSGGQFKFRFDVKDKTPCAPVDATAPERGLEDFDRVELFFSPTGDMSSPYYCMEIGVNGAVLDYRAEYYRKMNYFWGFKTLKAGSFLTGDGYTVTGAVSVAELASVGVDVKHFWLGVFRADFSPGCRLVDWYAAVPQGYGEPDFHRPKMLMEVGLEGKKKKSVVEMSREAIKEALSELDVGNQ